MVEAPTPARATGTAASAQPAASEAGAGSDAERDDQTSRLHVTSRGARAGASSTPITKRGERPRGRVLRTRGLRSRGSEHEPRRSSPRRTTATGTPDGLEPEERRLAGRATAGERRRVDVDERDAALGERAVDEPVDERRVERAT